MNTEKIRLFEDFTLDLERGCLLRGNQPIHIRRQSYEVLKYLVANKGRLISKDQLIEDVWQGRAVTDGSLGKCIEELRAALGKDARLYVRNVRGRGYIFDPKTDEQGPLESEPGWSEQIDVVRVVVEDEYHENDAALPRRAAVSPLPSGVSTGSRRTLRRTKAWVFTIAVLLVSIAVITTYYYSSIAPKAGGISNVKSLAVLPFKSLSGETGNEYLGLGMADTLITRLSNLKEMAVRPTSAVIKYGDSNKERIEICRELGVDAVLEGSIHISGGRMRVTVQLVSVRDQTPIWAETFDERFTDIFTVEDSISERVAERLALKLSSDERKALGKHYTEDTEAHLLSLSGRYRLERKTPEATRKAIEFFQRAIEKDPNFALAYADLALSYFTLSITGHMPPGEAFPLVKEAATKALTIDPLLADAYVYLGVTKFFYDWDWPGAERDFKRAIELNPNSTQAHSLYGHLLSNLGRHDEALAQNSKALALDPLSLIVNALRGQMLMFAGRYDEAVGHLQKAIDVEPNFWVSRLALGSVYQRKKMYPEAIAQFLTASDTSGGAPEPKSRLAYTYAVSGEPAPARRLLNELKQMATRQYVSPKQVALVYAGLGQKNEMFEWLEKSYENRDISLSFMKVDQSWNEYRTDPRFADLMRRVGFTQ
jgi:TolB-like protein/DNA-binding winged helix-turn-helix (wHTH) protein